MDIAALIQTHGYWVLALGCFLEGETILVLAGFAAHQGYLNPGGVVAIAAIAGFSGDQAFFWIGRRHGHALLRRWPALARQNDRVQGLIARFHGAAIIAMRFAYGLRIAGPVMLGMSGIRSRKFVLYNAAGAMLWAVLIGALGWLFGHAAETALGRIQHLEVWLIGLAVAGALALALWGRRRG